MDGESHHGVFPFGQPNRERPMRLPSGPVEALVVGVYPSAFHVSWSPPPKYDPRPDDSRRRPFISSLAVDVEPTVFWTGENPSPDDELVRWKQSVEFDPARHGQSESATTVRLVQVWSRRSSVRSNSSRLPSRLRTPSHGSS